MNLLTDILKCCRVALLPQNDVLLLENVLRLAVPKQGSRILLVDVDDHQRRKLQSRSCLATFGNKDMSTETHHESRSLSPSVALNDKRAKISRGRGDEIEQRKLTS